MGEKLVPNYEVKLLMDPAKVLDDDMKLKDSVKSEFKIKKKPIKMSIQFIDTHEKVIREAGWNLRIRKSEGEENLGLTYKKRYPVTISSPPNPTADIDAQVSNAHGDGFDKSSGFVAQIEVGLSKQTLSISYNDDASGKGYDGMDLPHAKDSRKILTAKAPQHFSSLSASTLGSGSEGPLADAVVYGPVDAKRYKGQWGDFPKLYIEVWPIRAALDDPTLKPTVEASFKTDDVTSALKGLHDLKELLQEKGWFSALDSLKTNMIMDYYTGVPGKS